MTSLSLLDRWFLIQAELVYSFFFFSDNSAPKDFPDSSIVREDRILGNIHLETAIKYALGNFKKDSMISRSLWNEILLYLSLQRQVHKAFEIVGVKNFSGKAIRVHYSREGQKVPVIEISNAKIEYWNVSRPEEILERMAIFHLENY